MPQMAPLNWLSLFLYFSLLFLLINPMNFFMSLKPMKKNLVSLKIKSVSWKW